MAPRLGDVLGKVARKDDMLDDVSMQAIIRNASRKSNTLNLASLRMSSMPDIGFLIPELQHVLTYY